MSTPTAPSTPDGFCSGFPAVRCRVRLATVYGTISRPFGAFAVDSPPSSPKDDTYPLALRDRSGQVFVSFSRPISRATAKPHVLVSDGVNRSWENGILNSAVHPFWSRDTVTSHTASQLLSLFVSLNQYRSCLTPSGLTANSYAVRRSWYESINTRIQSQGE